MYATRKWVRVLRQLRQNNPAAAAASRRLNGNANGNANATASVRPGGDVTQSGGSPIKPYWNRVMSEAERIVGYPASFLSLRWLLSDEIANVALHMRRLVSSNHPLLKTAKSLLYNGPNNTQAWGLIVLLVSKAAGHQDVESSADEKKSGVLHSQRAVAEIAEMIRTSHLMHNSLLNPVGLQLAPREPAVNHNDMTFGNKIALLSGDYLLANSFEELSALRNQHIMELLSSVLRDLAESEFVGRRDAQNNPLPSPFEPLGRQIGSPGIKHDPLNASRPSTIGMPVTPALHDWTIRNVLSSGSLLGKSCQGALILGGHGEQLQEQGFLFGIHLSLAWQAYLDLEPFLSDSAYSPGFSFNLTSAPVMFHLEHDPSLFEEIDKGVNSVHDVDYIKVHESVMNGPGVECTKRLHKEHSRKAMEVLHVFKESDARTALSNIIVAMDRD